MIAVWGRENSTNIKKVLWCLEELELPYTVIPTGGKYGGNHSREYLEMNPNGLVPCLRDDESDLVLWESNAIVRYLTAQYGQSRLWIELPALRAQAEKWMDWSSATLSPAHRTVLMGMVRTPPEQRNQQEIDRGIAECTPLLTLLDEALRDTPWFSGSEFGIGDIALAPYIWNFYHCAIAWPTFERLEDWQARLSERPAYRKIVMIPVS